MYHTPLSGLLIYALRHNFQAYMIRLHLWGIGTGYDSFAKFCDALQKRRLGGAEMMACYLKQRGDFVSRQLSFAGTEFDMVSDITSAQSVNDYNLCSKLWIRLYEELLAAERCGDVRAPGFATSKGTGAQKRVGGAGKRGYFWAAHQRFFKAMCNAIKAPKLVEEAKKELAKGNCVVIALMGTGEGRMKDSIEKFVPMDEIPSLLQLTFDQVITYCFVTPDKDDEGSKTDDEDEDDEEDDKDGKKKDDDDDDEDDDNTYDGAGKKRSKKRLKKQSADDDSDDDVTFARSSSSSSSSSSNSSGSSGSSRRRWAAATGAWTLASLPRPRS